MSEVRMCDRCREVFSVLDPGTGRAQLVLSGDRGCTSAEENPQGSYIATSSIGSIKKDLCAACTNVVKDALADVK